MLILKSFPMLYLSWSTAPHLCLLNSLDLSCWRPSSIHRRATLQRLNQAQHNVWTSIKCICPRKYHWKIDMLLPSLKTQGALLWGHIMGVGQRSRLPAVPPLHPAGLLMMLGAACSAGRPTPFIPINHSSSSSHLLSYHMVLCIPNFLITAEMKPSVNSMDHTRGYIYIYYDSVLYYANAHKDANKMKLLKMIKNSK